MYKDATFADLKPILMPLARVNEGLPEERQTGIASTRRTG